MAHTNGKLTALTVVSIPVTVYVTKVYGQYYRELTRETQKTIASANSIADEMLSRHATSSSLSLWWWCCWLVNLGRMSAGCGGGVRGSCVCASVRLRRRTRCRLSFFGTILSVMDFSRVFSISLWCVFMLA
jgi:hypothetical protein